jgi:hypothetical protein
MTKLEQIQQFILEMSPDELKTFSAWFEAMQEENFDRAVERDARSGKLDGLIQNALADFKAGRTRAC